MRYILAGFVVLVLLGMAPASVGLTSAPEVMTVAPESIPVGPIPLSPMTWALMAAGVLSLLTVALIDRLKGWVVPASKRKVRLMALVVAGVVAIGSGVVTLVAMGTDWQVAVVTASGPFASLVIDAALSLIGGEPAKKTRS